MFLPFFWGGEDQVWMKAPIGEIKSVTVHLYTNIGISLVGLANILFFFGGGGGVERTEQASSKPRTYYY